jgi:hypothetical protein
MWTISELKANARSLLKNYYWKGVAVCLIAGILMGTVGLQQRSSLQVLFNGGKTASFSDQFDDFYEKYKSYIPVGKLLNTNLWEGIVEQQKILLIDEITA